MRVGAIRQPRIAAPPHAGWFERARRTRTCDGHQVCSQQHSQHLGAVSLPCTAAAIRPRERLNAPSGRCGRVRAARVGLCWLELASVGFSWHGRARTQRAASVAAFHTEKMTWRGKKYSKWSRPVCPRRVVNAPWAPEKVGLQPHPSPLHDTERGRWARRMDNELGVENAQWHEDEAVDGEGDAHRTSVGVPSGFHRAFWLAGGARFCPGCGGCTQVVS